MSMDIAHWQLRLAMLIKKHGIVGGSLAISSGDDHVTVAAGVLNIRTGQPATPDSIFQVGSITKVWTATLVMQLVDEGLIDLDAPVVQYLSDFRVADEQITATVTTRQLLSHTSGIDGDLFLETGRGDDALAKYVTAMIKLARIVPPGHLMSYCNSGYCLLGHLVATLRGQTWENVLRERLLKPMGLTSAGTLPEEALLYGAAAGHLQPATAKSPEVAPQWGLFRSAAPAGLIHSTAAHQIAFARLHMRGGVTADGKRLLSDSSAKAMREPQVEIPDRWLLGTHWGLGWILDTWGDQPVFGHDGATLGQSAFLRVLPECGLVISLLANGGRAARALYSEMFSEIAQELAGVTPPPMPQTRKDLHLDPSRYVGSYRREGMEMIVAEKGGGLTLTMIPQSVLAIATVNSSFNLVPHSDKVMLMCLEGQESGAPVVFFDWDGRRYMHTGARTMPRVSA